MSDYHAATPIAESTQEEPAFPPRPEIPETPFLLSSIFSLLAFVVLYYIFFDHDVKQIAILVAVLFIHELGHFLAMKIFGYSEVKMFFIPLLGALVTGNKEEISQKQRAIILLAGPVPGIIIGAVLYYFGLSSGNQLMVLAAGMFVILNALNLLPLNPLDGGRLIETLFFHSHDMIKTAFVWISAAVITGLAIRFEMYTLLILPFALILNINQNRTIKQLKESLHDRGLDFNKSFSTLTDREYWLIREQIVSHVPTFRNVNGSVYEASPRERQIAQQMKNLAERKVIPDLSTMGIVLFTLIWLVFLVVPCVILVMAIYARM